MNGAVHKSLWTNLCNSGPDLLIGSAEHAEDAEKLVDLRVSREERPPHDQLSKDAANGPDVDRR
jgi:hypothetical protein